MRLTNEQMAEMFLEAYDEGIVTDLETSDCGDFHDCELCPANKACSQLSGLAEGLEASPTKFQANYNKYIAPLVKDKR